MKKLKLILTAIIIVANTNSSNAQMPKNTFLIGGAFGYYNGVNKIEDFKQKIEAGDFTLSFGKIYSENKAFGLDFIYQPQTQKNFISGNDTVTTNYNYTDFSVYYREYKKLANDFYFFGQFNTGLYSIKNREEFKVSQDVNEIKRNGVFCRLVVGVSYQIFKKIQFEITIPNILVLRYYTTKFSSTNQQSKETNRSEFQVYSGITNSSGLGQLGVGFRFTLGKKK